jgi:hypothetical protein
MRSISATLALKPVISEEGDKDIAGAVAAALVVPAIDADTDAEAAVAAIETAFGSSTGLKVFIAGSPTKAQVLAALEAVGNQVKSSSLYS